ncbi:hypothetical protein DPMN_144532 [Dreissena polymorpha]|uniref:Uncharacterized protein n=1 Tax=Dreissena polymorpha TaxID=45954 RepID=A0A9D4JQ98_DREPO|nr:hypothetical protein DPMN_144532 [Dreissena polymorpha]
MQQNVIKCAGLANIISVLDVGFVYRDCVELSKAEQEESGTQEYSAPDLLDSTLEG